MAALLFIANASAQTTAPSLPAVASGTLQLWLKADAGLVTNAAGQVSQWQDQSGRSNHANQTNASYQPLLVYPPGLGGNAAVRFNASQDKLTYLAGSGDVGVTNAMTTFTVVNVLTARTNGSSGNNYVDMVWLIGLPPTYGGCRSETDYQMERTFSTWAYGYNAPFVVPTNTCRIWTDRIDTNLTTLELFDTSAAGSTNFTAAMPQATPPGAGYYVGGINPALPYVENWSINGDVAEWIVYKGSLSEADRLAVLNYLQQKYFSSGIGQAPFTNSLVAYYPFNGNANDATGKGNNGQIIGDVIPATDRFGVASNAYHFNGDGSSSAIEITNTLFNIGQAGYTISGWFASDDISESFQILWNSIPQSGIVLGFNDGNVPPYADFAVGPALPGVWTATDIHGSKTDYANQTWYQTVLTKNGTTYTLYIDGQFECQQTISAAAEYSDNVGLIIGSITPINPPYPDTFFGRLDDFRVYNRALSSSEVQELYAYESVPQSQPCLPYAATATATIVNGFVVGATLTDGGCGYTNTPEVSLVGGGGSGAIATAVVSNGVVVSLTIIAPGSGYVGAPTVDIDSPTGTEPAPFANSLVAYYPFNGNGNDATGHGNNGKLTGNVIPATDRFGNASSAYHFDGSTAAIQITNTLFNIGQTGYSLSAWFASDNVAAANQVIFDTIPETGAALSLSDPMVPGYVSFAVGTATGPWTQLYMRGSETYSNQTWYQVVLTKSASLYTLYINGQISDQQTIAAASEYNFDVGAALGSALPNGTPETFLGRLDDFRFYNRALTSNEVQELYAYESVQGSPPPQETVPFTNSLVAYYPFNGNANDATGHGNNGKLAGNVVPATDRFGNASSAYHFDGSTAAIQITNTLFNIGQPGYSISAWFASDNVAAANQVIFDTIPETGAALSLSDPMIPGYVSFAVGTATGIWTQLYMRGSETYSNQTWYQVVLTKSASLYTLYINGQISDQQTIAAASEYNFDVGAALGSALPNGTSETFLGRLDDYRFYNRALSSNEVQELYAYESAPSAPCVPYPATATATVVNGFVVGATVTDGGCGYTNTPVVLFVGGGGTGAMGTAVVSNGVVVGITVTSAGGGYTNAPVVDIYSSLVPASQIGLIQAVIPTFSGLTSGLTYQLQVSTDLNTWNNAGSSFVATNASMVYPLYFGVTNWNELYFRLQAAP